jgi:hypothetical protein
MFRIVLLFLMVQPFVCLSQYKNIKLDERSGKSDVCEPAVAVNPRNPANIVVASIPDNIYVTNDGGKSWDKKKITSPFGVYGDPVLVSDNKGNFFFFHLSDPTGDGWKNEKSLDAIICHASYDGGKTWDEGYPIGMNVPKDQDKPWASVDSKGNLYVAWTQFDKYNSRDSACQSMILLSSSSNGKKWSKPVQISQATGDCLDDDNTPQGAIPAITDDKKVLVAWAHRNQLYIDRSFDGGSMWLSNDIAVVSQKAGWKQDIPGHGRCNGMPVLMVDKSKSNHNGLVYLVYADQNPDGTNSDVFFLRSNNFGDNWTSPLKISDDGGKNHQYMPWMAVDKTTGYIYVVYYDRRAYDDNQTDVYLAYSRDNGTTFKNVRISESAFVPDENSFFGDYINISVHNGTIVPAWTRMDNGKTSVWCCVIQDSQLP